MVYVGPELRNTMSLHYLAIQIEGLAKLGFPKEKAFAVLGLNPKRLTEFKKRISLETIEALYETAEKELKNANVGLEVGNMFRIPKFGQTGAVYTYCDTIEHVIRVNSRYQCLAVDAGYISYDLEESKPEDRHFLTLKPYDGAPPYYKHVYSMIAGAYGTAFKWLGWSAGKDIKSIYFPWPEPKDTSFYKQIYSCPIHFSQPYMRVEFYDDCIRAQMSTSDPEKLAQTIAVLESLLQSELATESFRRAVKVSIRTAIGLGVISLPALASRMKLSEQKLRKKLSEQDLSYRAMLDDVRKSIFEEMFKDQINFAAISQELGYNDQAAFNRAFKRWYGMSPTAYKNAQQTRAS